MVNCVIKNWQGEEVGETSLNLKIADPKTAQHIVHRALVRQTTNARQGSASTKTRSEVRGGGRKPWRQKGTGRARAGSTRSPLWRGGGVIFGPKPRDYNVKMNRKERRLAIRTALANREEDLLVVEPFSEQLPQPKTKELAQAMARWGIEPGVRVLMILDELPEAVSLSARNMPNVKLMRANSLNIYDILAADQIVTTPNALEQIQEVYSD